MSWIEKINDDLIITTGDGREWRPLWIGATVELDYNVAEFDFPEIEGTYLDRTTRRGARYALEIYFQGADCIDTGIAFVQSANDKRSWVVSHPYYGLLSVHPLGLRIDNSQLNVTKITGTIVETINSDNPRTSIRPADNIALEKSNLDAAIVERFDENYTPADVNSQTKEINKSYSRASKLTKTKGDAQEFRDKYNKARTATSRATSNTFGAAQSAMSTTQSLINGPAMFTTGVKERIGCLTDQFNSLRFTISKITSRSGKKIYEGNAVATISAQCLAAVNPSSGDYTNRVEVIEVTETLIQNYNGFIADLDTLQSDNGGDEGAYIPDPELIISLGSIVSSAITALFSTSLNARQERRIILEDDTDIINLTHMVYGLDPLDNNIDELIKNNNFGLNECLEISKGTEVLYYI